MRYLGSVDISTEPDKRGAKTWKSKIAGSQLLETREDTTIPFYLVDETFNEMSLFVYMFVICSLSTTITSCPIPNFEAVSPQLHHSFQ